MLHKRKILLTFLLFGIGSSSGQTATEKVVGELDSLVKVQFDEWRYSTDMSQPASRTDYNDSLWGSLTINQRVYPDSAWLRKVIILPEKINPSENYLASDSRLIPCPIMT